MGTGLLVTFCRQNMTRNPRPHSHISFFTQSAVPFVWSCSNCGKIMRNIPRNKGVAVTKIMPVSELRDYNKVLRNVYEGQPVFLTKNGHGKYAILDLADYEKTQATLMLFSQLAQGEQSAKDHGWLSANEIEKALGL